MKRSQLIAWLKEHGHDVFESNGCLWIISANGAIMILRIRFYYSRLWLFVHFKVYSEMWIGNWRENYKSCMVHSSKKKENQFKSNNMEQTFTNKEVRSYLTAYYNPTFRKGNEDHFYNYRNRKTIGLTHASVQMEFTEKEIIELFTDKTEHPVYDEIVRLKNHITNNQTS